MDGILVSNRMQLISILPSAFFEWCEGTALGAWLQQAMWGFATIETIHIMALAVLLGTMIVVDLRLLGLGLKQMPTAELSGLLAPWFWTSLVTMFVTGACLFAGEAVRLSKSGPFAYKMLFLLIAIAVHLSIHRKAVAAELDGLALGKAAAWLSIVCWLGIALAGRAIAFL
jgi:hypothetical protein